MDELPNVLWSHRTTPKASTGESPFKLAYGTEAVLPVEISIGSSRIQDFNIKSSEEGLRLNNDLLEETRDSTLLKMAKYQQKVSNYCNTKSKKKGFSLNDLVLRESSASMPSKLNKMSPPWEGPYKTAKVLRPGTYRLAHLDCSPVQNAWNASHL